MPHLSTELSVFLGGENMSVVVDNEPEKKNLWSNYRAIEVTSIIIDK